MAIKGKRIVDVRLMTSGEMKSNGWDHCRNREPVVLVLDDGTLLFASADEEGNGPGALFGSDVKGSFTLFVTRKVASHG